MVIRPGPHFSNVWLRDGNPTRIRIWNFEGYKDCEFFLLLYLIFKEISSSSFVRQFFNLLNGTAVGQLNKVLKWNTGTLISYLIP